MSGQLRVDRQPAVLPACESLRGANPERSVTPSEQRSNLAGRENPVGGPQRRADAIEPEQTELSPEPQITIRRLRDGINRAFCEAVGDRPGGMRVLTDVQRRI